MVECLRLSVPAIQKELHKRKRYGLTAPQLLQHGRPLVDLLVPPAADDNPDETLSVRSIAAETLIRKGLQRVDGDPRRRQALTILGGLVRDGIPPTMEERRKQAARLFNVSPNAFRSGKQYEKNLVFSLAFGIFEAALGEETPGEGIRDDAQTC